MTELTGSKTEVNLLTAFAGESQARNRYWFAADQAKKEGYIKISQIFTRTAEQELIHAKTLFKFLEGGAVPVNAAFPAGVIGTTLENLESAAEGEEHEYQEMYPGFAEEAQEEGFPIIAATFNAIAKAEMQHAKQYRRFIDSIKSETIFKSNESVTWYCTKCGYTHTGNTPPTKCPACTYPQSYYSLLAENW